MRSNKGLRERIAMAETLSGEYLAEERKYISFRTQYYRAIRDAYVAGYLKALSSDVPDVPFWRLSKQQAGSLLYAEGVATRDRLLNTKEVIHKLGVSRGTLWRLNREGKFPEKVSVTGRAVR